MPDPRFTPGPWRVRFLMGSEDAFFVEAPRLSLSDAYDIEILGEDAKYPLEYRRADAHLIAAAPDLYEALRHIVDTLVYEDEEGLVTYSEQVINARRALAKARGEAGNV